MLHRGDANGLAVPRLALDGKRNAAAFGRALGLIAITFHCQGKHRLVTPGCSSQRSPTGHLNRGIDGVFEIVRVIGRGLVSIAEVHAIVAGAQLAQGKPEMARNRFGFLERHEYFKEMPQRYPWRGSRSVSSADCCKVLTGSPRQIECRGNQSPASPLAAPALRSATPPPRCRAA